MNILNLKTLNMQRKRSNVLDKYKILKRIEQMEKNKQKLKSMKVKLTPLTLNDIAKEYSKKLGHKISVQAISYIKTNYYDTRKKT